MLLQALYDFSLRDQDNDKTLSFDKADTFIFVEAYPKDANWLKVVDRSGQIGYIPKNYVETSSNCGKDECLDFVKEAIYYSKQNNLLTTDELYRIKENISWLEYREIVTRELRSVMSSEKSDEKSQNTAQCEKDLLMSEVYEREETIGYHCDENREPSIKAEEEEECQMRKRGSSRRFNKAKKDLSSPSLSSAPAESDHSAPLSFKTLKQSKQDRENTIKPTNCRRRKSTANHQKPVSGRTSRSCPLDPIGLIPEDYDTEDTHVGFVPAGREDLKGYSVKNKSCVSGANDAVSVNTPAWESYTKSPRKSFPTPRERDRVEYSSELDPQVVSLFQIVQDTGVDAKKSELIVHRVLHHISTKFQPDISGKVQIALRVLQRSTSMSSLQESPRLPTEDSALRFLASLGEQSRCKDRPRMTDESLVLIQIDTLKAELMSFDSKEIDRFLVQDDFRSLLGIVTLYSYESQQSIKDNLLDLFSYIGSSSKGGQSVLLASILPISIVQELYESTEDPSKLSRLAIPLITLMSSGESLPHSHHDIMGKKFVSFLLNYIEEPIPKESEEEERAKRDLLNLIIAYNLQFKPEEENPVIRTIAGREPATHFIDAVLFLFEREVDPLPSADRDLDSVLKLMKDMFSSRRSAEQFHTANMKALTDSLISRVSDMRPGNKRRTEYIQLIRLVLKNRDFTYRVSDVGYAFMIILLEDDPLSTEDQKVIRGICKEFPGIVTKGSISSVSTVGKG